ncbi:MULTISPECIES: vWA domain-containing protein [unclassified Archaeoglobus]|jgi:Ca-activated chloride channel family protein|uniref:vWA domain-containing protein n=1 Tax=unclassified Archaeoglobus TaxID=2643606 RepID=UPI0025C44555|nr:MULTISPECIES: VWA domain-containing protein [unclassified Archaeoglobus]
MKTIRIEEKPECRLCSSVVGITKDVAEDLLYHVFNPYHSISTISNPDERVKNRIPGDFSLKSKEDREKTWNEIKEKLNRGEIRREDINARQLVDSFWHEVLRELYSMGYVDEIDLYYRRRVIRFTAKAEKILGEKVLTLSLQNLEKKSYGENFSEKHGSFPFPSDKIVEFDHYLHSFDVLDVTESLLKSAMRGKVEIKEGELVARQPKHLEKCVYIMLIDVSDSMRGSSKMIGALEAALGLKRAIEKKRSNDELHIVAFSHKVRELKNGRILNMEVGGATDIGLALKRAREILKRNEGTGIIFLITDGVPTSSYDSDLNPWFCALREAEKLRDVNARLQIILFEKNGKFLELCEKIAKRCRKADIIQIPDPLDLKKYVIRRYMRNG